MLECDLTGKQVRKISVIDGELEVSHHTMNDDPGLGRGEFV
jgi:hypothetical protein